VDPERERPIAYRLPDHARVLTPAHRDALEAELLEAIERLGGLVDRAALTSAEQGFVQRGQLLYAWLTPVALLPYCRRLNPAFFDWLEAHTGPLASPPPPVAPSPRAHMTVPAPLVPERGD